MVDENLLQPEGSLDLSSTPEGSSLDPRAEGAASLLAQPGDDVGMKARVMADESLGRRVESILAGEGQVDPFEIVELAPRLGQADPDDVQDELIHQLEEPYERGFNLNVREAKERKTGSVEEINSFLEEFNKKHSQYSNIAGETIGKQREVATTFLLPQFPQIAYILNRVDPSFTFRDMTDLGGSLEDIRVSLTNMPTAQLRQTLTEIGEAVEAAAGFNVPLVGKFTGNKFMARDLMDTILGGIDDTSRGRIATTVTSYLEAAFIPGAGAAVRMTGRAAKRTITPGTAADAAARTTKGQNILLDAVEKGDEAKLAELGTDAARVVDDVVLPNEVDVLPSSKPYLDAFYLTPAEREMAATRVAAGQGGKLQHRVKDSVIEYADEGTIVVKARYGASTGRGFKNEAAAKMFANMSGLKNFTAVKAVDGNEWFVETLVKGVYSTDDVQAFGKVTKGNWGNELFGKNTVFDEAIVNTGNWAARQTAQTAVQLRETLKPYSSLLAVNKVKVNNLLQQNNGVKYLTEAEMIAEGLSEAQRKAMNAVYEAGRANLAEINNLAVNRARANGFLTWKGANGVSSMAAKIDRTGWFPGQYVTDMVTGKRVPYENIRTQLDEYELFRVMGDKGTPRFGVAKKTEVGKKLKSEELPSFLIHNVPGYLPRKYDAPYYVRRVGPTSEAKAAEEAAALAAKQSGTKYTPSLNMVETEAVATAQSPKSAAAEVERLKISRPDEEYQVFRASETLDSPSTFDELDALREAGLLRTTSRKDTLLPDVDLDGPALRGVEESINAMVNSTARSAGLTRWSDTMIARWEATFPDLGKFNVASMPARPSMVDEARYKEAMKLRTHIMMVNGMHKSRLSQGTAAFREEVADMLYNVGARKLGDEVSGLNAPVTDTGKKVAAAMFLFLNPARQALMQMTMIPTYAGVTGGIKYAATGQYARDALSLALTRQGVEPGKVAQLVGQGTASDVKKLHEAWNKYGPGALVQDHIFTAGVAADSGFGMTSQVGQVLGTAVQASKRMGFDFGTMRDKEAQWLFAVNRYKTMNNKMPSTPDEWKQVSSFAENLGLNMNSSDALLTQQGVIGLLTQFASHSIKMTGRVLGMEGQFTRTEKLRMGVAGLLTYGTAGYGANEVIDLILNQFEVDLEPDARQLVHEGFNGFILDTMFGLWDNDGDDTRLAIGQNFGPASGMFMGVTPNLLGRILTGSASLGHAWEALPFNGDFAALGVGKAVGEALMLGYKISGETNAPLTEAGAMAAADFFESFPMYNQYIRGMAAYNMGMATDAQGNPVISATRGEGVARMLFGIRDKASVDFRSAQEAWYGMYSESGVTGKAKELEDAAKTTAGIAVRMMRRMSDGELTQQNILDFFTKHNDALVKGMHPNDQRTYLDRLYREIEKSGIMKSQTFTERMFEEAFRGNPADVRDILRRFPVRGQEQAIEAIEKLADESKLRGFE